MAEATCMHPLWPVGNTKEFCCICAAGDANGNLANTRALDMGSNRDGTVVGTIIATSADADPVRQFRDGWAYRPGE